MISALYHTEQDETFAGKDAGNFLLNFSGTQISRQGSFT